MVRKCGTTLRRAAREIGMAKTAKKKTASSGGSGPQEGPSWTPLAPIAQASLSFWNTFLGLRMGPNHDQPLDANALARLATIIRAVSWVESKHGKVGANQPARDPMQCGNPGDVWWRELTGQLSPEDVLTRGPGLSSLRASQLPDAAEGSAGFDVQARISTLANKLRGHRGSDYKPHHSFFWSIPYLIHRINAPASGRTFRCGNLSRTRLIDGAERYNGGGDPNYRTKIVAALVLIGDIGPSALETPASAEVLESTFDSAAFASPEDASPGSVKPELSRLVQDLIGELSTSRLFPAGIQHLCAKLNVTRADNSSVSAEIEVTGAATPPGAATEEAAAEIDHHDDAPVMPEGAAPFAAEVLEAAAAELSGPNWVNRFPGSRSTADLSDSFKPKVENFLRALANAGATVRINATYRPPERAYLMHHAWAIARLGANPATIPAMNGVDIIWAHRTGGQVDRVASRNAAEQMVQAYGLRVQAALRSQHTARRAIDMNVSWQNTLRIAEADGDIVEIAGPGDGASSTRLHRVGRTYDVIKLASDPPHWSEDGH